MANLLQSLSWGAYVTAFGGFITIIGALLLAREQSADGQRTNQLLADNADLGKRIASISEQNATLVAENARLTRETLATITGGDSFPLVTAVFFEDTADPGFLACKAVGSYPLHNITLTIANARRALVPNSDRVVPLGDMWRDALRLSVGSLGSGESRRVKEGWQLPPGEAHDFNVFGSALNGSWVQELSLRRVQGRWRTAARIHVTRDGGEVELYAHADKEFPRNARGEPDVFWWRR